MVPDPAPSPTSLEFRRLMARWATGVSVVTSTHEGRDVGLTVNALLSVSVEPPLLLVSLTEAADSTPVVRSSGVFAVSFLAADQRRLSERFALAVPAPQKFEGVAVHRGKTGAALLDGALGWVECQVVSELPVADHRLFVGSPVTSAAGRSAPPLLFYRSGYAEVEASGLVKLPPPRE